MMQPSIALMPVLINSGIQDVMPMQMQLQMQMPYGSMAMPATGLAPLLPQTQQSTLDGHMSSSDTTSVPSTLTDSGAPKTKNGKSKRSVVVDLRLGRQRIAQTDIAVVSGMNVIVAV